MKTLAFFISIYLISIVTLNAQNQEKEILIVGTMHTVPKIVKKSYKPMLKRAIKYNPEAIYVESPIGNDTISWEYLKNGWSKSYKAFYYLSDSIQKTFTPNTEKFNTILKKTFNQMTKDDLDFLSNTFAFNRDNANYEFYEYLKKYGVNGAKKPTRHEDGDLTFKLAINQNIKILTSMDDQQTNDKYHEAWSKCYKDGKKNGSNEILKKLNKKDYNSAILPAIFRGLGKHVNKRKSLNRLHKFSSFRYSTIMTESCKNGEKYWNERNMRMAKNIGTQVENSNHAKNIIIVGASHVVGLEKELKENYPQFKITLVNEL